MNQLLHSTLNVWTQQRPHPRTWQVSSTNRPQPEALPALLKAAIGVSYFQIIGERISLVGLLLGMYESWSIGLRRAQNYPVHPYWQEGSMWDTSLNGVNPGISCRWIAKDQIRRQVTTKPINPDVGHYFSKALGCSQHPVALCKGG
jgi:hypothetical protein